VDDKNRIIGDLLAERDSYAAANAEMRSLYMNDVTSVQRKVDELTHQLERQHTVREQLVWCSAAKLNALAQRNRFLIRCAETQEARLQAQNQQMQDMQHTTEAEVGEWMR